MNRLVLAVVLSAFTAGCGGTQQLARPEPITVVQEVVVPVAIGCVPAGLTPAPGFSDTDADLRAAVDAARRFQLLIAGRAERNARLHELEVVVAGCPRAPVPTP